MDMDEDFIIIIAMMLTTLCILAGIILYLF